MSTVNPRAKLTKLQADLIRSEYAGDNVTQRALAKKYGVSQMAIWQVIQKITFSEPRRRKGLQAEAVA